MKTVTMSHDASSFCICFLPFIVAEIRRIKALVRISRSYYIILGVYILLSIFAKYQVEGKKWLQGDKIDKYEFQI